MQPNDPTIVLMTAMVLGWAQQKFLRAPGTVPNLWSYLGFGVVAVVCYVWATPNAFDCYATAAGNPGEIVNCLRLTATSIVTWYLTARGSASSSKDAGLAPATNSL